jgi:type IV secretory pathway TraG/TraD family ATPase VirD4
MSQRDSTKKKERQTKFFLLSIGLCFYLIVLYFTFHMGIVRDGTEKNPFEVMQKAMAHLQSKPLAVFPMSTYTFTYALSGTVIFWLLYLYIYILEKQRFADKNVGGSAEWYTDMEGYNKKYTSPFGEKKTQKGYWDNPEHIMDNVILAKDLYLSMNGKKTRRTIHQVVFGGSGAGKSYSVVKPNGLQMNSNYIFTDPKGELLEDLAKPLEDNGYEIKVFNLSDMKKSLCYNPYCYIRDENGVHQMVNCIVENTKKEGSSPGDQIWDDSMTVLLEAISFFMMEELPIERCNLSTAMDLIRLAQVDENNTSAKSDLDNIFDNLEKKNKNAGKPESMATKRYKEFRIASGKTLKSVLITTLTRLSVFDYEDVKNLMSTDTIHLEELGCKRQALFIIIPAAETAFNFLAATLYTQLFETLYWQVENKFPSSYLLSDGTDTYLWEDTEEEIREKQKLIPNSKIQFEKNRYVVRNGDKVIESFSTEKSAQWFLSHVSGKIIQGERTLPYNVRFILDEFANVGKIPGFVEKLSTMRSYKLWCTIILQNLGQLKKMWGDDMSTIIGNCDIFTFLGSQEKEMLEYIQTMLGSTTKRQKNTTLNTGRQQGKMSESYQETKANLLDFNEIREMGDNDCITFLRGERPFYGEKYNLQCHPNYKLSGSYSQENKFFIPFDNSKNVNPERDIRQAEEKKKIKLANELEKDEEDLISTPKDIVDVLKDACENKPENLEKTISKEMDDPIRVAETQAEKDLTNQRLAEAENEMENSDVADIWDIMM